MSKLISPNEIGAAFALIVILGKFVDLFSKPFFLFLYKATVGFFPGVAMLFIVVGLVSTILIMIRLHLLFHQRQLFNVLFLNRVHFGIKVLGGNIDRLDLEDVEDLEDLEDVEDLSK